MISCLDDDCGSGVWSRSKPVLRKVLRRSQRVARISLSALASVPVAMNNAQMNASRRSSGAVEIATVYGNCFGQLNVLLELSQQEAVNCIAENCPAEFELCFGEPIVPEPACPEGLTFEGCCNEGTHVVRGRVPSGSRMRIRMWPMVEAEGYYGGLHPGPRWSSRSRTDRNLPAGMLATR